MNLNGCCQNITGAQSHFWGHMISFCTVLLTSICSQKQLYDLEVALFNRIMWPTFLGMAFTLERNKPSQMALPNPLKIPAFDDLKRGATRRQFNMPGT